MEYLVYFLCLSLGCVIGVLIMAALKVSEPPERPIPQVVPVKPYGGGRKYTWKHARKCPECGRSFLAWHPQTKYCSAKCRAKARYERLKEAKRAQSLA